jgi:hypothetical protein
MLGIITQYSCQSENKFYPLGETILAEGLRKLPGDPSLPSSAWELLPGYFLCLFGTKNLEQS